MIMYYMCKACGHQASFQFDGNLRCPPCKKCGALGKGIYHMDSTGAPSWWKNFKEDKAPWWKFWK